MQKTYLYELIQTFSKQDIREARKWLLSPYINLRTDLPALFDYIINSKGVPTREAAWRYLFSDQMYDDQQIRLLMSYLYRSLEQYLVQREFEQIYSNQGYLLLSAYRKRGLDRHFDKAYHQQQKVNSKQAMLHPESHLSKYYLEKELFHQQAKSSRTREHNLQDMENALSVAFVSMKLRQACWLLTHEAVYKANYQVDMEAEILTTALQPAYQQHTAIAIYLNCYHMLKYPEQETYFIAFREQLFEVIPHFPQEEMRDLFILGINFCIRQINRNTNTYMRELLELYQKGLASALLLENGVLSPFTYTNTAALALRLNELDWAEQFLHQYRPLLEVNQQEAAFSLNAARLAFAKQDYEAVLSYLQKADYKDFINNMAAKTLLLKCYYELGELDSLEYHLKTMRSFLRRKHRMGYHQKNYRNIVRFAFKLLNLKPRDKAMIADLQKLIENTDPLTEREWLLSKLL
jgi:hypothetical protein